MSNGVWFLLWGHSGDLLFVQQPGWTTSHTGSMLQAGALGQGG